MKTKEMHPLITRLLEPTQGPCLTMYLPVHRTQPERRDDQTRYRALVRRLEESLADAYTPEAIAQHMEPFVALLDDAEFWDARRQGIAFFSNPTMRVIQHLDRSVPELAVVADSFHIKPILRLLQTLDGFQILTINGKKAQLFNSDRDTIQEIPLPEGVPGTKEEALGIEPDHRDRTITSAGGMYKRGHTTTDDEKERELEQYFRLLAQAVERKVSAVQKLPMILVGLPEQLAVFRKLSTNPWILPDGVAVHPDSLDAKELRTRAWSVIEPYFTSRSQKSIEAYHEATRAGKGLDHIVPIAKAAAEGRVAMLFVEADRTIPGKVNRETGEVVFDELDQPDVDDLLDDLVELVARKQADVSVLPAEFMPTATGCAAVLRW